MTRTVRVGINGLFLALGKMAGMETYLRALVRELPGLDPAVEYILFTERKNAGSFDHGGHANIREVICPVPAPPTRQAAWASRMLYEYAVLPIQAQREHIDVLFSPAFIGPARRAYASVITVHDTQHEDLPENFGAVDRAVFTRLLRRSVRLAAHILTVSEYAKRRIEAIYAVPPERITVTYHAADPIYFNRVSGAEIARVRQAHGLRAPYLLSVASLMPHKNLDTLVDAFATLRRTTDQPVQLALVGLRSVTTAPLKEKIRTHGLERDVAITGYVPDADMPALYQGAAVFVLPSRYEGFGIPLLEAMASGVPVVTTTATALPEAAGDAALLVDPDDRDGFVDALRRVLSDTALRERMIARGTARAHLFSWQRTAEVTLATLVRNAHR